MRSPPGFITLAQRFENARNAPDVSTSAVDGELFSMEELFNIFKKMISKIRLCRNKTEQLAVIGELLMLNGWSPNCVMERAVGEG